MEWDGVCLLFNPGSAFGRCKSIWWNPNVMSSLKLLKISLQIYNVFANLREHEHVVLLMQKKFRFLISQQNRPSMFDAPCVMEQLH